MQRRGISALLVLALVSVTSGLVSASSPRLSIILPRGVQRGQEVVLTFSGSKLKNAQEIFFYDEGFTVSKLEPNGDNQVKATVKVAPGCRLGEHVAQVRTSDGISDFRTFYVGALPDVAEKEPNSEFQTPQEVPLNSTVSGIVQSEDVDYFVVEAKKGQRISAEVEGIRLGATLFDPYVAILDSKRFELAASDDTALFLQDCFASVVAPEDGKYTVMVRESAYGGNGNCRYRLNVGSFPRPTAVYPAGGQVGQSQEVTFIGDPTGPLKKTLTLPAAADKEFGVFAEDAGGIAPSPNVFRLYEHGNALEIEPNNRTAEATPADLPNAFNGIIQEAGDIDFFKFSAKKGQVFDVECFARRLRSALDPVMNIYYADGKSIAGNDDSRGPDSYIRFSVPADGEYVVRVTDHLSKGGPDFVYRLEFHTVKPELTLSIPRVERYGQYRQQIYVARGNRFGTLINARRNNFGGDLQLEGKDLPAGVKLHCETMPSNLSSMPVVFEASADAPIAGKLLDLTARHTDEAKKISGSFSNTTDLVTGAPGQSIYRRRTVDKLAVAVVDELPFTLEIVQPKVPLVRGGSMRLKVVAHRKEGFDAPIKVEFPFRPPGVSAGSSVTIAKGQSEALYPLNANGGAQIRSWPIFAIGSADVNGTAWVSSQMAQLEIAAPFVTFAIDRSSCEQGQEAQIYCKLNHAAAFEGKAKARLYGLPAKTATEELEFTSETKELVFNVKTEAGSPAGKHRNVFCQVTITKNGEPIVSNAGKSELQIDKPLPPEKGQPAPAPKPKAVAQAKPNEPAKPKAKPLTRLQKLRLAAKQRAEAQKNGTAP